jgi:hypothetical protein
MSLFWKILVFDEDTESADIATNENILLLDDYSKEKLFEKQTHPRFADWGFQFILVSSFFQGSSLFRVPVYSGFQFIQSFILFRVPVKSGFLLISWKPE